MEGRKEAKSNRLHRAGSEEIGGGDEGRRSTGVEGGTNVGEGGGHDSLVEKRQEDGKLHREEDDDDLADGPGEKIVKVSSYNGLKGPRGSASGGERGA